MKKFIRIKLITTVGVLVSCLILLTGCGKQPGTGGPPQIGTPEVAVVTVQTEQVTLTTELPGRTSAYLVAEVRPQVSGIIQKRLFTEGSDVKAGHVLYQIDPAPFQAALDNTKAALARAEANLPSLNLRVERYKALLADKAVSQQDYDDAAGTLQQVRADIEYWKAAVRTARINLGYTRITAPISGRIGKSNVTDGALVTANQPVALAVIQQLDPVYVDVTQSTTELLRLKRSMEDGRLNRDGTNQNKVSLILEDGTRYPLKGTLQFRDVSVDSTTGSVILRVVFPNPKHILLPGMFVRAEVQEGVNKQAILIPQQAVSRDPKGNPIALIVDAEGKVQQRMLTLDRAIGDKWIVSAGLTPGERVVVEGLQKVRPGLAVKVVPFNENKTGHVPAATESQPQKRTDGGR
ncbi:MAG: efflux transporter periplasmic adaptor subunit [Nitrospirae bacterium CG_4_10_14_0_8_um_filter_41_23]|nr:MAG: efflux transporter periplasmic adaptor subunit [Nitrospirae bacterium CG11_big_fil_rev_8_21_14_0_20_41_14]PIV44834.1 MAG: efflux transporter periplasmic adaptor subunit [Nitrospirae bacterium CG02_land_8_20_14_3_00_41_53]PIW86582.1 MAG: efflux transporter periplasmic adaptor subunit [Nitrospirae bacterium CG_4_8_14_3_um_filter_41_47]PIY86672.1 MAG: efflux transporter periplasmic adaptor subunit [Nitrospirae bacterium CG_4_10_14_0_8_um_filter_41_23]PJA80588.1 MAG: efflux transporter peri